MKNTCQPTPSPNPHSGIKRKTGASHGSGRGARVDVTVDAGFTARDRRTGKVVSAGGAEVALEVDANSGKGKKRGSGSGSVSKHSKTMDTTVTAAIKE